MKKNSKAEAFAALNQAGESLAATAESLREGAEHVTRFVTFLTGHKRRPQPIATASTPAALALSRKAFDRVVASAPGTVVSATGQRVRAGHYASGLLDAAGNNATKIDDARRALVAAIERARSDVPAAEPKPAPVAPAAPRKPPTGPAKARASADPNSLGTRLLLLLRDGGPQRVCVLAKLLCAVQNAVSERLSAFQSQGFVSKVEGKRGFWTITDGGLATLLWPFDRTKSEA